jgi:hypothetical protein
MESPTVMQTRPGSHRGIAVPAEGMARPAWNNAVPVDEIRQFLPVPPA